MRKKRKAGLSTLDRITKKVEKRKKTNPKCCKTCNWKFEFTGVHCLECLVKKDGVVTYTNWETRSKNSISGIEEETE